MVLQRITLFIEFFLDSQILTSPRVFSRKLLTLTLYLWLEVIPNNCNCVAVDNFTRQTHIAFAQTIFFGFFWWWWMLPLLNQNSKIFIKTFRFQEFVVRKQNQKYIDHKDLHRTQ